MAVKKNLHFFAPKKSYHNIDPQIKLMSLESLVSSATSDTSTNDSSAMFGPTSLGPKTFGPASHTVPSRNQVISYPPSKPLIRALRSNVDIQIIDHQDIDIQITDLQNADKMTENVDVV
jgi:Uma2 family endonuclease